MKKSEYTGFAQVFRFTFTQAVRSKSLIITTLIMCLIALVAFPLLNLYNKPDGNYESPVEKVYVINETGMSSLPYSEAFAEEKGYDKVVFEETTKTVEALTKEISETNSDEENTDKANELVLHLSLNIETGSYLFDFYRDPASEVEVEDVSSMAELLTDWFEKYKVSVLDADEETLEMVGKVVDYTFLDYEEYLETDEHEIISDADYNVVYAFLFVAYMVIIMAASMVATKVVEEKANRVVEYLMTTVRPMALVLGKVLAMLLVTVGEMALIAICGFASNKLSSMVLGIENATDSLAGFLSAEALKSLSVGNVAVCIAMVGLGIFIYGLLAGLFGASVSKMEDLQQGLKAYNFIILISFFAAFAACEIMWTVGINSFVNFTLVFPLTSVFIMPGALLIGKASVAMIIAAIALQIVTAGIVLKIVSLVYESIIVMNGNPVTLKQMMAIARRR